jgi:hypothetical protein
VRRVDRAPTLIYLRVGQKPLHGAGSGCGDTGLDLAHLLGNVDVDRCGVVHRPEVAHRELEILGRHRPQRVQCQPYAEPGIARALSAQCRDIAEKFLDRCHEAPLSVCGGSASEVARAI